MTIFICVDRCAFACTQTFVPASDASSTRHFFPTKKKGRLAPAFRQRLPFCLNPD
jgi:hypothetical protein